ncbi:PRC and DUF2382 domain-containing protein [Microlunatus aurantiacus]|uniref:PRC and DUF2382 domain-containing protein n=1 Tax=Microlunatus aurantiacus TaxID=446786 RepID=A0ABP7DAZ2_9ACTN
MLNQNDIETIAERDVYDSDGAKIGAARQVYVDDETGEPEWVTVRTGLFGLNESFVPLADATVSEDRLVVPFTKSHVKDAPNLSEDGHLTPEQERELYDYYGRSGDWDRRRDDSFRTPGSDGDQRDHDLRGERSTRPGGDTSGPTTDDAMTVSEEQLHVGTERRESGRARLRKYVVTENVTKTVPVQREEVRVEREPITDPNAHAATSGPSISEEEQEVVLHEERPVVETDTVPVERVRLGTETTTHQETVSDEVRKERVQVDEARGDHR